MVVLTKSMRLLGAACAAMAVMACSWAVPDPGWSAYADQVAADPSAQAPAATQPVGAASSGTFSRAELLASWNALRGDAYPLDGVARWLEPGQRVSCDQKGMVRYSGTSLRYAGPVLVYPAFVERLERFEAVVAEVSREVYQREPRLVRHYGAFSCRSTRNRRHVVSEHALGNALDLVGFDFGPAKKAEQRAAELPKSLRGAFQVRVARHWQAGPTSGEAANAHARFWALLGERLRERDDIFRSMFGPGHGGHDDHLHLDVAPWRYVDL